MQYSLSCTYEILGLISCLRAAGLHKALCAATPKTSAQISVVSNLNR